MPANRKRDFRPSTANKIPRVLFATPSIELKKQILTVSITRHNPFGKHITSNFHLLTHLADSVLKWGCLWTTSTLIPEWFNGELISLANGMQAVVDQMAFNYLMRYAIRDESMSLLDAITVPREVCKLFEELFDLKTKKMNATNKGIRSGSFYLLGSPHRYNISVIEQVTLLNSVAGSSLDSFLFDEEMIKSKILTDQFLVRHPTLSPKRQSTITHC